jgi:hypothetical protein
VAKRNLRRTLDVRRRIRRMASSASMALACVALVGCESMPHVRFTVSESPIAAPITFEEDRPDHAQPRPPGKAIANAVILLPGPQLADDPTALASRIRDDPGLTERMHPNIGWLNQDQSDGAFGMRTGPDGTAEYSELRLHYWFSSPRAVERRFFVWADGYEPRTVTIDIGDASYRLNVPLERSQKSR